MTERELDEAIRLADDAENSPVCPLTEPQGTRIGDILLVFMFIIVPFSLLIYFISIM